MGMRQLFHRYILLPLKAQLTQGVSPSRLALALALGSVLGLMPMLGITTVLCALLAVRFRLNQPAIQLANYLVYPVQLLLFVPAFQAGAWLFGRPPISFSLAQLKAELSADAIGTMGRYFVDNLRALAAWGLMAPLLGVVLFLLLRALLRRLPLPSPAGAGPDGG
jgi:uncharacterized protein (DUF2062 family)